MAWAFYTVEHIHPFVDGNGRSGRLIFPYISAYLNCAVPHVSCAEVDQFYDAHDSMPRMRFFVAKIFKESVIVDGEIYTSQKDKETSSSGLYTNVKEDKRIIEWHALERSKRAWPKE